MFDCRSCCNSPLGEYLGCVPIINRAPSKEAKSKSPPSPSEHTTEETESLEDDFEARNTEEVGLTVSHWYPFVHPRCNHMWTVEEVTDYLGQIAGNVRRDDDPITGDADGCVLWEGAVTGEREIPVMKIRKPNEAIPTNVFVNRVMVYLFAEVIGLAADREGSV
eukprot:GHVU01084376.1.p2 GENE.GHVU01084376.1~~GHVU01084376.1.p2  ORF type:complete len:164 (+),score=23.34 GHVU01084376.1:409-900(+)